MKIIFSRLREVLIYEPETGIFRWKIRMGMRGIVGQQAGSKNAHGYNQIQIDGNKYIGSFLAWLYMTGEYPSRVVDHENRIRDDDRWVNLRPATRRQNSMNKKIRNDNVCGVKGVSIRKNASKPFRVRIQVEQKRLALGDYATLDEAAKAYADASKKYFGEFACV